MKFWSKVIALGLLVQVSGGLLAALADSGSSRRGVGPGEYEDGVSLFVWDAMTGNSTVCNHYASSSLAKRCALQWCAQNRVTPAQACDITNHCIFVGFAAAAMGAYQDAEYPYRHMASTACGEDTQAEADRVALLRCESEVYGPRHCQIVQRWQVK